MAEDGQNPDYPIANQLDVGVNRVEDRVVVIASTKGHGRRAVLLTRRLMKSLLVKYAQFLEQTSEPASQAAASHKVEVLQMEYISALSQIDRGSGGDQDPGRQQTTNAPDAVCLGTEVHFQQRDGQILLAFDGVLRNVGGADGIAKEPVVGFLLDRAIAHRVLAMLKEKADEAGWDLPKPSGWTDKLEQAQGALN